MAEGVWLPLFKDFLPEANYRLHVGILLAPGAPGVEEDEAEPVRFELAGENDHQLQQAVRLLKGEQIVQNGTKPQAEEGKDAEGDRL